MIVHANCAEYLRTMGTDCIDACVTDPPYGLEFMGKEWDTPEGVAFKSDFWREVLRVMKPGAHLMAFGGTRMYHRLVCAVEDAGFEIRDTVCWHYGSGFPKSLNVGEGRGTALKPATELIVLARKPLSEKTVAANVLRFGTGALNIDASRIGTDRTVTLRSGSMGKGICGGDARIAMIENPPGRFPANLILDEEAAGMLDEQSGVAKPHGERRGKRGGSAWHGRDKLESPDGEGRWPQDNGGGASRFFYCAKASGSERNAGLAGMEKKSPPGSKRSTPAEGRSTALGALRENHHPTVKPLALMRYLIRMVTPPGGTVLDPFLGSGTTAAACKELGFGCVGIEREAEYAEIATKRVGAVEETLFTKQKGR